MTIATTRQMIGKKPMTALAMLFHTKCLLKSHLTPNGGQQGSRQVSGWPMERGFLRSTWIRVTLRCRAWDIPAWR